MNRRENDQSIKRKADKKSEVNLVRPTAQELIINLRGQRGRSLLHGEQEE